MTFVSQIAPPASSKVPRGTYPLAFDEVAHEPDRGDAVGEAHDHDRQEREAAQQPGLPRGRTALPDHDHEQQQRGDGREDPALVVRDPVRQRVLEHDREEDRRSRAEERLTFALEPGQARPHPLELTQIRRRVEEPGPPPVVSLRRGSPIRFSRRGHSVTVCPASPPGLRRRGHRVRVLFEHWARKIGRCLRSASLDTLTLTVIVDDETDTLSSVDAGLPQVPEVVGLLGRVAPTRRAGLDCVTVFDHLCVACHGPSILVTGQIGERRRSVLFDVGPYGDVWVDNVERLGIDISSIDTVFLSHWHWDHSGGLPVAIAAVTSARRRVGLDAPVVVDLHPDRPDRRGVMTPLGVIAMLPDEPTFDAMHEAGGRVEVHDEPHLLADEFFLGSGAIVRRTSYETGLDGHHTFRGEGVVADPLIMDERYLAAKCTGAA